jgi:hypothetical protein
MIIEDNNNLSPSTPIMNYIIKSNQSINPDPNHLQTNFQLNPNVNQYLNSHDTLDSTLNSEEMYKNAEELSCQLKTILNTLQTCISEIIHNEKVINQVHFFMNKLNSHRFKNNPSTSNGRFDLLSFENFKKEIINENLVKDLLSHISNKRNINYH